MSDNVDPADPRLTSQEAAQAYKDQVARELQELAIYRAAVDAEFKDVDTEDEEKVAERVKARVIELVPEAATQIKYLINHADSEAIRKDLSKWVFQVAMRAAEVSGNEDEMTKLIRSLTK